jgi:hypothetical protein
MRPSTPEAPAALLPPPPLRLLPGGAIQFPGGSFLPLWTSAFSRRTVIDSMTMSASRVENRRSSNSPVNTRVEKQAQFNRPFIKR